MKRMQIALVGNANVGKSVIFNYLTKLHQHIGNWPGKTIERAEGAFRFNGYGIDVIDLPGIYSLSTYSMEEMVTREYIASGKPDVLVNVVDASAMERNLFLTLQLIEFGVPMVVILNQSDIAAKKGIMVDHKGLGKILGIPVVPAVAVTGRGMYDAMKEAIRVFEKGVTPKKIGYGNEIEAAISKTESMFTGKSLRELGYPRRWAVIKLLEGDRNILKKVGEEKARETKRIAKKIEDFHKHSCPTAITCERYAAIGKIAKKVQSFRKPEKPFSEKAESLLSHNVWGYPIMFGLIALLFVGIFTFGDFMASAVEGILLPAMEWLEGLVGGTLYGILLIGSVEGIVATLTVIIPYILPFYVIFGILEDSGYLTRMAFLMDKLMHKIGLHGKAFIPMIMGYGCNVPACLGCRIMETRREKLIAIFVTTLIPCAAVTSVILGLVARYVSIWWAAGLYVIDLAIILVLGRLAFRALPGRPSGLIMEIPPMKRPHVNTTIKQAWFRIRDFVYVALPIIVVGTVLIKSIEVAGVISTINGVLSPVTVYWLGLPVATGIALIFGIMRKELTLVMLAALLGTTNFAAAMTNVQMLVFALVTMLYIPCAATIAALVKEIGWKRATLITVFEILFAIAAGGVFVRVLQFLI